MRNVDELSLDVHVVSIYRLRTNLVGFHFRLRSLESYRQRSRWLIMKQSAHKKSANGSFQMQYSARRKFRKEFHFSRLLTANLKAKYRSDKTMLPQNSLSFIKKTNVITSFFSASESLIEGNLSRSELLSFYIL
ncbi:hypothetical protein Tcan_14412 [Toxocara canis]|uniref:Uncharacterized protein n=1 Tax=Toxocara canis TaxID=6265 RepID=A0A0B2VJI6_TOXCA|nr:hypothetical protein Tcan_14412 [Toxocara canis]